jgi:hypothetical protein
MVRRDATTSSALAAGTNATSLPSFATWNGSSPRISARARVVSETGTRLLVDLDPDATSRRDLVETGGETAARRVAHRVRVGTRGEDEGGDLVERRGVAHEIRPEVEIEAPREDRDAVIADRSRQTIASPARRTGARVERPGGCRRCQSLTKRTVGLAAVDDLVSPVATTRTPAVARALDRGEDATQVAESEIPLRG